MGRNNLKAPQTPTGRRNIEAKLAYRKKKTNEDRTLNKESLQWRKRSHTISALIKPTRDNDIVKQKIHEG
jgi:hypothetical protein